MIAFGSPTLPPPRDPHRPYPVRAPSIKVPQQRLTTNAQHKKSRGEQHRTLLSCTARGNGHGQEARPSRGTRGRRRFLLHRVGRRNQRAAAAAGLRPAAGGARRRAVRQLATGRGGEQQARLEDGAGGVRGLRRALHARRAVPARLARRGGRGRGLRRVAQAARRRKGQGGVGVRHRRDLALKPPVLRHPRLRVRVFLLHSAPRC
jgi:hypothetical protein